MKRFIEKWKKPIESYLECEFNEDKNNPLKKAMRYSILAPCKRVRPLLCIASAACFNINPRIVIPPACAIEMIHTYSLIHDDLPAMDNDNERRGQPSCHIAFGEAIAILAGDALQTKAFEILSTEPKGSSMVTRRLKCVEIVAKAAGIDGMAGGQMLDLKLEGKQVKEKDIIALHSKKTGALIQASMIVGAVLGGAGKNELENLSLYGEKIGLAFQVMDDILDITGTRENLGKTTGKDTKAKKATFPSIFGIEKSKKIAAGLISEACSYIGCFGKKGEILKGFASLILNRTS